MQFNRSSISILIILAVVVLVLIAVAFQFGTSESTSESATEADITLIDSDDGGMYTDLDGATVKLADLKHDVLVVNAWASWCPFCARELPDLSQLGEEYKDRGVIVVGINRKESQGTAKAFVEHIGSPKGIMFLLDSEDFFYRSIGGFSMPETVFYNGKGDLIAHKRGFMELEEMRSLVNQALASNNQ